MHEVADCVALVRLDVEKNRIRLAAPAVRDQLREQRLLHEIETDHQKRSQSEREQQQQGAIVRAMEIGESLPPRERKGRRNGFASQDDERFRQRGEKSEHDAKSSGKTGADSPI